MPPQEGTMATNKMYRRFGEVLSYNS